MQLGNKELPGAGRTYLPVPVALPSATGIVGSNPAGGVDICLLWVLSGKGLFRGWSPVQGSPTDCDMPEYDHVSLVMRRPWYIGAAAPW